MKKFCLRATAVTAVAATGLISYNYAFRDPAIATPATSVSSPSGDLPTQGHGVKELRVFAPSPYKVNSRGETFGSALGHSKDPDLVAAIGTNGRQGYVRAVDLMGGPDMTTLAQVEAQQAVGARPPSDIPLYESDGVTVIGTFRISSA